MVTFSFRVRTDSIAAATSKPMIADYSFYSKLAIASSFVNQLSLILVVDEFISYCYPYHLDC